MYNLLKALALLLLMGATGCIRENSDECPQVNLVFRYDADGTENVIGEYIREAILYVFDRNGNPVMERKLSGKELQSTKGTRLILPAKAYRLICWGNVSAHSRIILGDKLKDCRIQHALWDQTDQIQTFDPLYHASCDMEALPGKGHTVEVKFHSAHVRMEIYLRGFNQRYGNDDTPVSRITGLDGQYNFEMEKVAPNGTLTCFPPTRRDETGQVHAAFAHVLRFQKDSPIAISICRAQDKTEVFHLRTEELFRNFPDTLLDREEAVITVTIDFSSSETHVSIVPPDWEEKPVSPGI